MSFKDDGSTSGGIITVACILLAFCVGYWIRDMGIRVKVDIPSIEQRRPNR